MEALISKNKSIDTGYAALIVMLRILEIPFSNTDLSNPIDNRQYKSTDIIYNAKQLGLKAKEANLSLKKVKKLPTPFMFQSYEDKFYIMAKSSEFEYLVFDAALNKTITLNQDTFEDLWNGKVILFKKHNVENSSSEEKFGFKWFMPFLFKYKAPLIEVIIATLLLNLFSIFTPLMVQVLIDKVLAHNGYSTLSVLAVALIVVAFFEFLTNISRNYIFNHTGNKIDVILSSRLFKHLLDLPLRYFEVRRVGDTVARVKEIENIRRFLTGTPLTSILDAMFIFVYIFLLFFYSPKLTFIVLGSLPFLILLSVIVTPLMKKRLDEKFNRGADTHSFLVETVTGIQTVKTFSIEEDFKQKWDNLQSRYIYSSYKTQIISGNANAVAQFIQKTTYLAILFFGAHQVINNEISLGQLIAFQMLSSRVSEPVLRLVQLWQDFQQTGISVKRIGDIFDTKQENLKGTMKSKLPNINGTIDFKRVTFRYDSKSAEVIRDLSFRIPQGSVVGIVGRSGSGKSTVSKLVQRLYIPEQGKILIDGIDTSLIDSSWLRKQIGVVLQENFMFNGSIRENISLNKPGSSMNEVINVAKIAGAHDFILELPEGYDTLIGENGTSLSGGQRQRIAIARALIANPKILILDEATSALDYESETIIQQNLKKICHGRTVLIIAHRLSTLKDADRIMVIDRGSLVEYNTQETLLKNKGLYHHLHSMQNRSV